MNEKTTPVVAPTTIVPTPEKATTPVQALKTETHEKAEPAVTPAPKS
jgi:hypothetical protein